MGFGFGRYFDVTYAADIKRPAVRTYRANHPEAEVRQQDVRNLSGCQGDFSGITGVIGGPPCQGSSVINTKRCAEDPRNGLMLEFMRLVDEARPEFFVLENVPGVNRTLKNSVVSEGQAAGYTVSSTFLNAAEYGAAQTRKRWVVVGLKGGRTWHPPEKTPSRTVRQAFAGLGDHLWGKMNSSEKTTEALKAARPGEWTAMSGGKFRNMIKLTWQGTSPTVINPKKMYMVHPDEPRNLSLSEAAALQGFPPAYAWRGTETEIAQMIANAMPTELAAAIAGSLAEGRGVRA